MKKITLLSFLLAIGATYAQCPINNFTITTPVTCNGLSDGTAIANPSSGTGLYTFLWLPGGQTDASINGLSAGSYTLTINDETPCTPLVEVVTITEPAPLAVQLIQNPVSCFGGNNGSATAIVSGGTASYSYAWLPGLETTAIITGKTAGTYSVTVTDFNGCNLSNTIVITAPISPFGIVTGSTTVCRGTNTGTVTLTNFSGSVVSWVSSINNGVTWANIASTLTTHSFTNITQSTLFAAIVNSGGCGTDTSQAVRITVNPVSVGGTVSSNTTVCAGSNSGALTLSGNTGGVLRWEYSTDGGTNWVLINNTTTTLNFNNLIITTAYRAIVQSGVCASAISSTATVTVNSQSNGGLTSGAAIVCSGTNSGTITLSGNNGNVLNWIQSTDGGLTWTSIANTASTQTFTNLTQTTIYAALVQNGVCSSDTSQVAQITVDPLPIGGTISTDDTVCAGANSGILTLSGHTGNILRWEYSTDGGATWVFINNNSITQAYSNLITTTIYRTVIQGGVCSNTVSATATITVNPVSIAGNTSGSTIVCSGTNTGNIFLSGSNGIVISWAQSVNGGTSWTSLVNTTNVLNYSNLNQTTFFAAVVQSGVCPTDTSGISIITVNPTPIPSFSVSDVCIGQTSIFQNNSTVLTGNIVSNIWDFGDSLSSVATHPTHVYARPGTFLVTLNVVSDKGCSASINAPAGVNSLPNPTITANGPVNFCFGGNVVLSGDLGLSYLWSTSETTQSITVSSSGTYSLTVTNFISGCQNSDTITVVVYPLPIANAGNDTIISLGSSFQLNASGGVNYLWTPSAGLNDTTIYNPIAYPLVTTNYILLVTDEHGCMDLDTILITVLKDYLFTVSNAITPNGDGSNDVWVIQNLENYPDNTVAVYNRYGQEVFSANGYNSTWDAKYNGKTLPDGTYYYVLTFDGSSKIFKGGVTIIDGH
jgi:trimeric autotransporter adhesin